MDPIETRQQTIDQAAMGRNTALRQFQARYPERTPMPLPRILLDADLAAAAKDPANFSTERVNCLILVQISRQLSRLLGEPLPANPNAPPVEVVPGEPEPGPGPAPQEG